MRRMLFVFCALVLSASAFAQHVLVRQLPNQNASQVSSKKSQIVQPFDLASASGFNYFERYPAEEKTWLVMSGGATAYFRDTFVGGDTTLTGLYDGEQWYATSTAPGSSPTQWSPVTFYSNYNGSTNCFLGLPGYGPLCGSAQIEVLWYQEVLCATTGVWKMDFYDNGVNFYEGTFTLLPQIAVQSDGSSWVPSFSQADTLWATHPYDKECYLTTDVTQKGIWCSNDSEEKQFTIRRKGCMVTALSNIIDYHALPGYHVIAVAPDQMNDLLNLDGRGWNGPGNVDPRAVARVSAELNVPIVNLVSSGKLDDTGVEASICRYGPQPMEVLRNGHSHWVTVYGRDAGRTTWLINDPANGDVTTLQRYANQYVGNKVYAGPEYVYSDRSIVSLLLYSPVDPVLTDPSGNKVGYDNTTQTSYAGVPNASYQLTGQEDIGDEISTEDVKELLVLQPSEGTYQLKLTGSATGTYNMYFNTSDSNGDPSGKTELIQVPTYEGSVQQFEFTYAKTPGAAMSIQLSGGFDGGGQRPRDVNKFLSYANPTAPTTTLPTGVSTFQLMLFYGATTDPATFSATLNGADVTRWFHPETGTFETVPLPLVAGKNVLQLSIKGFVASGREATDSDKLVFVTQ
ncbi:MAG TPA: hypothetical protein VM578_00375 [Candidatus Saccharimonadales bacterium]|nr:hypothetical protein [Candidatus Saccharimonadales bacterium]